MLMCAAYIPTQTAAVHMNFMEQYFGEFRNIETIWDHMTVT